MSNFLAYGNRIVGGGGNSQSSGGHVIENSSGTDLTQRDTLKFTGGLKATDDSSNSKTIIDDSPTEITWTQWNNLTPEQQAAIPKALITDAPDTRCSAENVSFDNVDTSLSSTNIQDAIEEIDNPLPIEKLNGIYRGKAYTTTITTAAQFQQWRTDVGLADGSFSNIRLGDSVTINDGTITCQWMVAGFNTEIFKGATNILTTNHVALIPVTTYTTAAMNSTDTTVGGFMSAGIQAGLETIANRLTAIMSTNLLTRDTLISNMVNTDWTTRSGNAALGTSSSWDWKATKITLMSENQVHGCSIFSSSAYDVGEASNKLPIFNFISPYIRMDWWLRDVATSSAFCYVGGYGGPGAPSASSVCGVRPLIIID